nr:hypothetical protein [Propionibacterium sp.]
MRTKLAVPALATAAVLFAGCTAQPGSTPVPLMPTVVSPQQSLMQAVSATGQGKDLSTSIRLDATADDLKKVAAALADDQPSADDQKTIDTVSEIVPKVVLKTALHSRGAELNTEKDPNNLDGSFALTIDGKPLEGLWVGGQAFLHADVDGIGKATGLFTTEDIQMIAGSMATSMPWINKLVEGQWVALDKATVAAYLERLRGEAASASPTATPSIDAAKVSKAFVDVSTVTKVDESTFKVVTDVKKVVKAAAAIDPNDDLTDTDADEAVAGLNDGATLDATISVADGKVTKIVIDIADIMRTWPKPDPEEPTIAKLAAADFKLNGVIELSSADPQLKAPTAAATIPASDLKQLLPS